MAWYDTLEKIKARHHELSSLLSSGTLDSESMAKYAKEYSDISPIVEKTEEYQKIKEDMEALELLLEEEEGDMRHMIKEELQELKERFPGVEQELKMALLPKDENDKRNVILEIRAGTGGDEAELFAGDLLRMYTKFAALQKWTVEMMDLSESDMGGVRLAQVMVSGHNVYGVLKYESGVHRVQRVPVTESSGRLHTSAATVAVLPEADEVDIEINEKDLRIDTYRSQGAGGQHVNTTDSAVRITHIPSGVVVQCQDERSQIKNRIKAMKVLRSKLFDDAQQKKQAKEADSRKQQVGSGDRSERIRTYNFPQGRVTDHRIGLTLYKLDKVIIGEALDEIIEALRVAENTQKLSEINDNA